MVFENIVIEPHIYRLRRILLDGHDVIFHMADVISPHHTEALRAAKGERVINWRKDEPHDLSSYKMEQVDAHGVYYECVRIVSEEEAVRPQAPEPEEF